MATFLYNPDRKPKQELIAEFVVRTGIYEEIMNDLETSKMKHPEQHYLLVGQRGAGKTTLLNRIRYGVEDSDRLRDTLIPVLFSEEQYNISELENLWESVAQYLEDYHGFEGLYEEMETHCQKGNFEELSYDALEKRLKDGGKKLLLLVDNVGDLLKKLDKTEVHRLREILQTKSEVRLIAGSPFYLETILDYHQPFFEFFKVLRLDGLTRQETESLLLKLAAINGEEEKIKKIVAETPERIETLRTLTGGVPRTISLMFTVFVEYNNEDAVKDLEKILDAATPLYKHRMDDLPAQQQKIVDAVAKNWDGVSVGEIKQKLRIESKVISAQLRQLEKNQIIERVETGGKNNLYFLKERFFNIWYLMRYGSQYDKQRVVWLVKFLESWCTMDEIEQRIVDYVKKVNNGVLNEKLVSFYGEVYGAVANLNANVKLSLKESTPKHLSRRIAFSDDELRKMIAEGMAERNYDKVSQIIRLIDHPSDDLSITLVATVMELVNVAGQEFKESLDGLKDYLDGTSGPVELPYSEYLLGLAVLSYANLHHLVKKQYEEAFGFFNAIQTLISRQKRPFQSTNSAVINYNLMYFLASGQNRTVETFFERNPEWKEVLKPTYYAHLFLLREKYEVLKMGSELVEKVQRIINVGEEFKTTMKEGIGNDSRVHER